MHGRITGALLSGAAALLVVAPAWAGGSIERVDLGAIGTQADRRSFFEALSADGRFVAFTSKADNLVPGDSNGFEDVFVRDRKLGTAELVSIATTGKQGNENS